MATPAGRTRTEVLEGTQDQIDQAAQASGLTPRYVVVTDGGEYADFDTGPAALGEVLRYTKGSGIKWHELSLEDQEAVLWTAASSPQWSEGNIDPYQVDRLMETNPQLAERLKAA